MDDNKIIDRCECHYNSIQYFHGLENLIGKIINQIYISDDKDRICFETNDRSHWIYLVYGDCCSTSYIDSICYTVCLKDNPVIEIIMRIIGYNSLYEVCSKSENARDENELVYAYEIKTLKGVCVIDFRNVSNGYYGGRFDLLEEDIDYKGWKKIIPVD